jgi:hypothetical protein
VILYIDACLAPRLGKREPGHAWLGDIETFAISPADRHGGDRARTAWLPNEQIASCWTEFMTTVNWSNVESPKGGPSVMQLGSEQ